MIVRLVALLLLAAGVAALWYSALSQPKRLEMAPVAHQEALERDLRVLGQNVYGMQGQVADFALKQGALQRDLRELTQRQAGAFYLRCTRESDVVNCVPTLAPVDGR